MQLSNLGVDCGYIGTSERGRPIPCLHFGKYGGDNQIIIQGAIHAREWPTAKLVMEQAHRLAKQDITEGGIWLVPMANPDGNLIVEGLEIPKISIGGDHRLYKANANGVDLNTNFDAQWGQGASNVFEPHYSDYVGCSPFSERESQMLRDMLHRIKPVFTISYHAKGREVYYLFDQNDDNKQRDKRLAEFVSRYLDYELIETVGGAGYPIVSAGGYKDYCISRLGIPSITIEIIDDRFEHPLTYEALMPDIERNIDLPKDVLEYICNPKNTT